MTGLRLRGTTLLALTALVTTGLTACSGHRPPMTVTVLAPWAGTEPGTEGYAFRQILSRFEAGTGIRVNYQDTRAILQLLRSEVQGGTPPDVAILPSVGEFAWYANAGDLRPLDGIVPPDRQAAFPRQWLLPRRDDDYNGTVHIYTVPVKADLESLIWYNPTHGPQPPPRTWDELLAYGRSVIHRGGTPWCMGLGDPPSPGWEGTDMIEDILLHQSGPDVYRRWAGSVLPWNSIQVKRAWQVWGALVTGAGQVHGGRYAALLTDSEDAGRSLFENPPQCYLAHESSYILGVYPKYGNPLRPGTDFDFFPFPNFRGQAAGGPWEASADLAGMFRDTPQARQLMRFLASNEVQQIWAANLSGAFSVNRHADLSQYRDPVSRRIATILATEPLCYDAANVMPTRVRTAFHRATLEYLNNPRRLPQLLGELEQVRLAISGEEWVDMPCSR